MKKKLVICIPSLRVGGAAKIALNLSEQYLEEGMDVHIILTDGNSKDPDFSSLPAGLQLHKLPQRRMHHFIRPFINAYALLKYFRKLQPDAILAVRHDATAVSALAWWLYGRKGRFVIREINPITKTLNRNAVMIALIRWAYRGASAVIANSTDVAEALKAKKWLAPAQVHTIDNPVLTKSFYQKAAAKLDDPWLASASSPLIVTIGRLDKMKDQATLIRAFAILRKQCPARLMLIGDGPEAANLQQLVAELNLQADVKLPGAMDNPYPVLKQAELFVLSSRYEGFGNVLVEALSLGKKVISTACTGGPAYILNHGEYGRLFPVGDHEALAAAMSTALAETQEPAALIDRALHFSAARIAAAYAAVLFN